MRILCTTSSLLLLLLLLSTTSSLTGFLQQGISVRRPPLFHQLHAANRKSSFVKDEAARKEQEEQGAQVVGAQFFGGSKIDQDLFDPVAEANAVMIADDDSVYVKWNDPVAFPTSKVQAVAKSIQGLMNAVLYVEDESPQNVDYVYASNMIWETPLSKEKESKTPLDQLELSLEFFNRLDVAITSGRELSDNQIQLRWELSVAWPTLWEPRVLVTGTSELTLDGPSIIRQVDSLDNSDLVSMLLDQLPPRFWDMYHLGMSPSAELQPKHPAKGAGFFSSYSLYDLPPRLVYRPSILDRGTREDANAATLPNHAFCDFIKTTGKFRQRYITTSPLEVRVSRTPNEEGGGDKTLLTFTLPVSVELQTCPTLPLPPEDEETIPDEEPQVEYVFQSKRRVATIPYGGQPQDAAVVEIRKKLYEQVVRDGFQPKVDATGRPQFFFWSYNTKNCFTEKGLGMAIYEYRWQAAKTNEIGIELEVSETS